MCRHESFKRVLAWFALFLLVLITPTSRAQTFTDDFSKYPNEGEATPAWEALATGWMVADGAYHGEEGASVWQAVPWGAAVRYSCNLTVLEQLDGDWLTAGIGLQQDEGNFWALNLVVSPEETGRKHSIEMQEMLKGVWLAQSQQGSQLEYLPSRGSGFNWQTGQTYRLEMELSVSNITGRVLQGAETVADFGYRFIEGRPAVRLGLPMVRGSNLKAKFDNAKATVIQVASAPAKTNWPPSWASRPGKPLTKGTGFFRTLQTDGRWWLVDPEGKPFFDVGADHVSYRGHWCEALGYAPYHRNMEAKYGNEQAWGAVTLKRLKEWGFNCLPAGHSQSLRHQGLAHIEFASFGTSFAQREWICRPIHWTGFPDVFSPRWESHCRMVARRIARDSRGDPWCIGIFLDNELEWYGKQGHLVDEVFQLPPQQAAKKAFYEWLVGKYTSLTEVNRQLGTRYADQSAFLNSTNVPPASASLATVRGEFLSVIAERYFKVASEAMRQADPDHLVMGCRFAGQTPEQVLAAAGRYNDVFTINTYPRVNFEDAWASDGTGGRVEDVPAQLANYYRVVQKPIIITEWSFPALDSGLPCKHGAGMRVDTQEQKAACYRIFAQTMADLPFIAGYHYFMWADEPPLGISSAFPEDSNYGLVNEKDEPYPVFTKVAGEVNAQAERRHARSTVSAKLDLKAAPRGALVANTNAIKSKGVIRLVQGGQSRVEEVNLKPGQTKTFKMPSGSPWVGELQNWDGTSQRVIGGKTSSEQVTILNVSSQNLVDIPAVVEHGGSALGTVQTLSPGISTGLNVPAMPLKKQDRLDFNGGGTHWASSGKTGALFDRIECNGLELGKLVFAVHQQWEGKNRWTESSRVLSLETVEQPDAWVVEAEVEHPDNAGIEPGYRARVRAVVFKKTGLAMVRPLWVESLVEREWQLVEAYWFCRSSIGGSTEKDIVGGPGVPNYYRAAHFITDTERGGCFGSLHQPGGWEVIFWTNPEGGIHPDSRLDINKTMRQGERWEASETPYLWVYASKRADAWKDFARLNQNARQLAVQTRSASEK
jgi:hypothetical protein